MRSNVKLYSELLQAQKERIFHNSVFSAEGVLISASAVPRRNGGVREEREKGRMQKYISRMKKGANKMEMVPGVNR